MAWIIAVFCYSAFFYSILVRSNSYEPQFEEWASQFRVSFQDKEHRQSVLTKWIDNHVFIQRINGLNLSYSLGHNQFSGMDTADFSQWVQKYLYPAATIRVRPAKTATPLVVPADIDWTKKGAVNTVQDQGQCGSCWSFSAIGALEGAFSIQTGQLQKFSEQQLVDCDNLKNGGKDHGCNGGLMDNAFTWIMKNHGICLLADYPYVSGQTQTAGACDTKCIEVSGSNIRTFVDVEPSSDASFVEALSQRPLAVAIEADQREFQLYKSGVFTGKCGTNLDHGVLAVGYAADYYKVKNSWSTSWGENGYIRLARGDAYNGKDGQCGILLEASYPIV